MLSALPHSKLLICLINQFLGLLPCTLKKCRLVNIFWSCFHYAPHYIFSMCHSYFNSCNLNQCRQNQETEEYRWELGSIIYFHWFYFYFLQMCILVAKVFVVYTVFLKNLSYFSSPLFSIYHNSGHSQLFHTILQWRVVWHVLSLITTFILLQNNITYDNNLRIKHLYIRLFYVLP